MFLENSIENIVRYINMSSILKKKNIKVQLFRCLHYKMASVKYSLSFKTPKNFMKFPWIQF